MTSGGRSGCTFPVYYYAPSRLPSPSISYFLFSTTVFSIQCLQSWDYAKLTCIISNCSPQYPSQDTAHTSETNAHIEKPQFTFSFFFGWGMRVRGAEVWECRIFAAKDNVHHLLFFLPKNIFFDTKGDYDNLFLPAKLLVIFFTPNMFMMAFLAAKMIRTPSLIITMITSTENPTEDDFDNYEN